MRTENISEELASCLFFPDFKIYAIYHKIRKKIVLKNMRVKSVRILNGLVTFQFIYLMDLYDTPGPVVLVSIGSLLEIRIFKPASKSIL